MSMPPESAEVWAEPDERCLRGLATVVHFPPIQFEVLAAQFRVSLPNAVESTEVWVDRLVTRFVLQFVLEVRLGERDGQLTLHHRTRVPPELRRRHEDAVVALLRQLAGSAPACSLLPTIVS